MSDRIVLPTLHNFKNITGNRYGRLFVIEYLGRKDCGTYKSSVWKCKCDCGQTCEVSSNNLRMGKQVSCGCLNQENRRRANRTHGLSNNHRLFHIWMGIKARCFRKTDPAYRYYGARGIDMCEEWRISFQTFYDWSLSNGYRDDLTIDRYPNRDGNYDPSNCRWATWQEQAINKDSTTLVSAFGESKTTRQWVRDVRARVSDNTLRRRIRKGWDAELAITTPASETSKGRGATNRELEKHRCISNGGSAAS